MLGWWKDWERCSKGRRQIVFSQGLREYLGLGDELDDDSAVNGGDYGESFDPTVDLSDKPHYVILWLR